jgi:UDP-N-acetylglucosamine diphosphorylase / glucose-1-phosphate thymidylyltransferase / UDP-N-acetylgalactosamine diphosphorylase / glucosamine-1-phosphate N-acetyltransferase / galactosamine-1-phosphate N-acetyltransferase
VPAELEAVVMAAGEGTRLRPVTERYAKPVLPIDGRPVIATLLREIAAAGIERATVVTGHLAEQVESLVGDGTAFGLAVRFARQPRPDGSADAVRRAIAAGARPPLLISAADTVYTAGDLAAFAAAFVASGAVGALAARDEPGPAPGKPAIRFEGGRVTRVIDEDPLNRLASAPLWALGPELAPWLEGLPGPPFELALAYQRAIDAGVAVTGVVIGATRDLTYPVNLVTENFPYLGSLDE